MVCSTCGFDNQLGMRFCGMCGTPLPHRPITAPGANSTLNFTRVPFDASLGTRDQYPESTSSKASGVLVETSEETGAAAEPASDLEASSTAPDISAPPGDEPPPHELVPDVPLDQYVQTFHYDPPSEPGEVTMRGDAHLTAPEPPPAKSPAISDNGSNAVTPGDNIIASTSAREIQPPLTAAGSEAAAHDLDSRLGLEPETPTEARIARPRFLDLNEVPKEPQVVNSGTSTIAGPSFLGLNDPPQTWSQVVGVNYEPRSSHWRAWLAVVIVLIFGGLGWLEWRSQNYQIDNGPVEVIRAKVRSWRHGAEAQNQPPAEAPNANNNGKPEIQVQEQPKAQTQSQTASGAVADGTANSAQSANTQPNQQPATTTPVPAGDRAAPGVAASTTPTSQSATTAQTPVPADQSQKPAATSGDDSQTAQKASTEKPKTKRSPDQEITVKQIVPGADEMAKAKNASDSAASAAWLWKATARGNPEAPVELADMYIKGDGVPRSCEQALVLLKTAADKANAHARNRLASMYATGNCVPRSRVEAYRWVSAALTANPTSEWAQQNRALLWQQMSPDERVQAARYR